jgi:RHS repeat-associated protein
VKDVGNEGGGGRALSRSAAPTGSYPPDDATGGYAYTAREWDPEINLYYYRARYYDPKVGRFVSEDPITLPLRRWEERNPYTYTANQPTVAVDPSGMQIYVCTRWVQDPWWLGAMGGRHVYIWSSCYQRACGQGNAYGTNPEGGPGVDECVPVGDDNCSTDWKALSCCAQNVAVPHATLNHDCHTTVDLALDCSGQPKPPHSRWKPPWFRAYGLR